MSLKQRERSDDIVIDLTKAEYFASNAVPATKFLLTLPDKSEQPPAPPDDRARYGDLGLAATLPIKRRRLRARFRDVDALTLLGITVVLSVSALMLTLLALRY